MPWPTFPRPSGAVNRLLGMNRLTLGDAPSVVFFTLPAPAYCGDLVAGGLEPGDGLLELALRRASDRRLGAVEAALVLLAAAAAAFFHARAAPPQPVDERGVDRASAGLTSALASCSRGGRVGGLDVARGRGLRAERRAVLAPSALRPLATWRRACRTSRRASSA